MTPEDGELAKAMLWDIAKLLRYVGDYTYFANRHTSLLLEL